MRVLIVSDNASSKFGGEAFLPFNYFRLLRARNIDVRLLVHERNWPELTKHFPDDTERLHFVPDTLLHKAAFRVGSLLPRRVADVTTGFVIYLTTQVAQRRFIQTLSKAHGIDVIHVPIPVSPKAPSLFYGFGAPVIFGPMNGGMEYPPAFRREEGAFARAAVAIGRKLSDAANFAFPGKRQAPLLIVANARTRKALPRGIRGRVMDLVENGVDFSVWRRNERPRSTGHSKLKLIFVGRLVDWKALDIVFEAIKRQADKLALSFEIIGDGPMRAAWEKLSEEMGLQQIVRFSGWMNQQDCARHLNEASVFVLPSLFESGGAVVLEAMAMGLPVIATGWGGPIDYLDDSCGMLIAPSSREYLVAGFAEAISRLAEHPDLRVRLGEAGYDRARSNFDWERKIDRILELYYMVKNQQGAS